MAQAGQTLPPEMLVHRIGGGRADNLRLKPREATLTPPGISVLLGGTPEDTAEQMRQAFPDPKKFFRLHELTQVVGSATAEEISRAGFAVLPDPSAKLPNHARLIHPQGTAGFTEENLVELSKVFRDKPTPRS